jgi:hypothetical protein
LCVIISLSLLGAAWQSAAFVAAGGNDPGRVEKMVAALESRLQPGDLVMSVSVYEPPMWYYFRLHRIPWSYLEEPKDHPLLRYLIVIYGDEKETVDSILQKRKVDPARVDLTRAQKLIDQDNVQVFAIPANP